jgi:predicted nucleotidyltransferase
MAVDQLVLDHQVYKFDEFIMLHDNFEMVVRRRKGNVAAKKLLDKAVPIARLLSSFPYVRGIAVSGSLSKNFADENSDIDFFIITAKNRLWIARTIMHLFKKLAILFRKEYLFCMNYYVDEEGLEIKEKNIYTATELATLMPLRGIEVFQQLYMNNQWSKEFLPNYSIRVSHTNEVKTNVGKKMVEWCFTNKLGDLIDDVLMRITAKRWGKKKLQRKLNANGNVMGMDTGKHYSKPDPLSFQQKMMEAYANSVAYNLNKYEHRLKPVY